MKVRFGIIGLGNIAARFAKVLNMAQGVELNSVAALDMGRAERFKESFGAKKAYDKYIDLIKDGEVDVIYIAQTHNFHFDMVKLCLNNNKPVICEKPLVTNKKDAEELVKLARENNVLLMEAMWSRCIPTTQKVKQWVKEGKIGEVKLINASFAFNFPFDPEHRLYNPKLAGGSLYDVGVYPIEFATGILEEKPTVVNSVGTISKSGVDDFVVMNMKFNSGALASLSCGFTADTNRDAHIYGSDGQIVVYDFLGPRRCELYDRQNNLIEVFEESFEDGFIYQINHFVELYMNNKIESDIIPLQDTIDCAEIFDTVLSQCGVK
ncbi:Gfo/Idh/MocA family protein [Clostridium fungisolvens]|uniref:Scyllo-inositol 2-dehydrogenase (NADP(+)) IolU n=1 Tax=Clostridium fungisolvens TaxID=1604897 RepID=A0A6V8SAB0_9CLOT|nr:Gfo/Idh/MocA family oxidoreductase [Clostridium fungisolvens]GFP74187.1 scyllo-inositol 2-dehydrogenase (NADP(+)) IolU [Clostridium fungisolvens]